MGLDFRTLAIAVTLSTAFCAAARVLLWRMHPGVPGLGQWTWAGISSALALVLFASFGTAPEWLSLSLPQIAIALGLALAWDGFRRFLGRAPLSRTVLATLAVAVLVPLVIAHLQHWLTLRALGNSLVLGVMSALIARELFRREAWSGAAARVTAYLYALNSAFFFLRLVTTLRHGEFVVTSDFPTLSLLWWMCMTVAVTLGMALMTGERLQWDVDRQASRDPLTGALNRRAFSSLAEREVARARRTSRPLSLLMMDLDHFKRINDQLGHAAGDDALCRFVTVAGRVLRGEDLLCRFGGEEFVALLPETTAEHALAAAERLRVAFSQSASGHAGHPFTVSMGIAELHADETLENTLKRADTALYGAKAAGRNRCVLADEPVPAGALRQSL